MEEAEICGIPGRNVVLKRFEQDENADDVGFNERCRAVDRAVDMGFCGKVYNRTGFARNEQILNQGFVGDRAFDKFVLWIVLKRSQVLEVSGICERVERYDLIARRNHVMNEIRSDESSAARHQYRSLIHRSPPSILRENLHQQNCQITIAYV